MEPQNIIQIDATVQWQYYREPEMGWYVGNCDALGLTIEGATHSEMIEMIQRAQDLMFRYLLESGELPQFLDRHHWAVQGAIPQSTQDARFELPFALIQDVAHGTPQHAH